MGRGMFFARLLRSLADCLGVDREPPPLDSYTCASHPARLVGHPSSVASMIETTDRVCSVSENLKGVDRRGKRREEEGEREMEGEREREREREREMKRVAQMVKEKELGKKLARETKREMERKKEMQREMERVAMTEMAAARQRHIRARITARSEKAREEREKVMAMTLFPQLQVEKERVRADAVGASLVAEEEAEKLKVLSKKEKKKAKELKRKARLEKVFSHSQGPKAFVPRGVQPKDCRWPQPPEALPTFSHRSVLTLGVQIVIRKRGWWSSPHIAWFRSRPCFAEPNATMV